MTTNTTRSGVLGGPPGSLKAWLFGLRLPASLHRVLELHCEKADAEDGCHWRGEPYIAYWTGMTDRNVRSVNRELEGLGLLKVWPSVGRSNVYQVQCPQLGKLNDCGRVEAMLGRELGAPRPAPEKSRRKSRTPEKTSAPEPRNDLPPTPEESRTETPEESGTEPRNGFPPSSTSSSPIEQQDPQGEGAPDGAAPLAADAGQPKEPQPPNDQHEPFQWLHWHVYEARVKFLGDRHYDPWPRGKAKAESKALTQCKTLMEGPAHGDLAEAKRRLGNLCSWHNHDPDFYDITAGELLSRWSRLLNPPEGRRPRFSGAAGVPPAAEPEPPPPPPAVLAVCTECQEDITHNVWGVADARVCARCSSSDVVSRTEFKRRRAEGEAIRKARRQCGPDEERAG